MTFSELLNLYLHTPMGQSRKAVFYTGLWCNLLAALSVLYIHNGWMLLRFYVLLGTLLLSIMYIVAGATDVPARRWAMCFGASLIVGLCFDNVELLLVTVLLVTARTSCMKQEASSPRHVAAGNGHFGFYHSRCRSFFIQKGLTYKWA